MPKKQEIISIDDYRKLTSKQVKRRGLGQEDQIHIQFGQLMLGYERINKLNCVFFTYLPFGEQRKKTTGALLKKKGAKRGVPDFLFIKNEKGIAKMIWLEFKTESGKQSSEQFDFQTNCEHFKNMSYYIPRSIEEAIYILEEEQIIGNSKQDTTFDGIFVDEIAELSENNIKSLKRWNPVRYISKLKYN